MDEREWMSGIQELEKWRALKDDAAGLEASETVACYNHALKAAKSQFEHLFEYGEKVTYFLSDHDQTYINGIIPEDKIVEREVSTVVLPPILDLRSKRYINRKAVLTKYPGNGSWQVEHLAELLSGSEEFLTIPEKTEALSGHLILKLEYTYRVEDLCDEAHIERNKRVVHEAQSRLNLVMDFYGSLIDIGILTGQMSSKIDHSAQV